ncbi:hypothetical protein [Paenibacillus sp. sgz500958]|uniref:hypothetical protein n=1 Tax=Paenibacillus sp. sgz500958 TaxID=3242475 RepID=UPI0036D401E1
MIKNRSFMLGLGVGLLAGALLLQLMISARVEEPTKERVAADAARLNLKVVGAEDDLLTREQWESLKTTETDDPSASQAPSGTDTAASPTPAATSKNAQQPDQAVSPSEPAAPSSDAVEEPEQEAVSTPKPADAPTGTALEDSISLSIPSGNTLSDVAELLTQAGVIEDTSAFLREADSRGVNTKIQYGKYVFAKDESFESIIKKLITLKK